MATKTISITEDAYDRLASLRKDHESFSKIIERITNKVDIMDFAGILNKEEAGKLEKNIKRLRFKTNKRLNTVARELDK